MVEGGAVEVAEEEIADGLLAAHDGIKELIRIQRQVLEKSRWVGGKFAEEARSMHYGEAEVQPIHGETSIEEAEQLIEEGIEIAALPFPVAPPDAVN